MKNKLFKTFEHLKIFILFTCISVWPLTEIRERANVLLNYRNINFLWDIWSKYLISKGLGWQIIWESLRILYTLNIVKAKLYDTLWI